MAKYRVYNANASEVIEAKNPHSALDEFIKLHPEEVYNQVTIRDVKERWRWGSR